MQQSTIKTSNKYALIKSFYKYNCKSLESRVSRLSSKVDDYNALNRIVRQRTIIPRLNRETILFEMAKKTKYRKHIRNIESPGSDMYLQSLAKARNNFTDSKDITDINEPALIQAATRVLSKINPSNIRLQPKTLDQGAELLQMSSSSGFPNFKKQSLVFKDELLTLKLNLASLNFNFFDFPTTVGFRLQLRESDNQIATKARVIYMFPCIIKICEAIFFYPMYDFMRTAAPFYASGYTGAQLKKKFKATFSGQSKKKNFRLTSTDFSSYDLTISPKLIILAFAIIRQCFKLSRLEIILFEFIVRYFCSSIIMSNVKGFKPDTYLKVRGIPSGSTFTNLIGTIVHAIMYEYINPNKLDTCFICSDDNIFLSTDLDLDRYSKIMTSFGMTLKIDNFYTDKEFYFLGFNWLNYDRHVSEFLVINQCIYHTEFRTDLSDFDRIIGRCASIFLNGKNGIDLFSRFFPVETKLAQARVPIKVFYLQSGNINFSITNPTKMDLRDQLLYGYLKR